MSAAATAHALDAADGVIDGRHFGRPIVQAGAAPAFGGFAQPAFASYAPTTFGGFHAAPTYFGGASSTAAALDAADGVIDGRHFGRPIVQAGAAPAFGGFAQPAFASYAPTTFGGFHAAPTYFGGASSTAAALDAADGVIDGRHFGRPIVQAGGAVGGLVPYTGAPVVAAPQYVQAAPVSYGAVPAQYYGGYGAAPAYGASYVPAAGYGNPIFRGAPVAHYGGSSAQRAAALDAADGVMDGRHFGRPIVQQRRF
jgi:hypothetical protein